MGDVLHFKEKDLENGSNRLKLHAFKPAGVIVVLLLFCLLGCCFLWGGVVGGT